MPDGVWRSAGPAQAPGPRQIPAARTSAAVFGNRAPCRPNCCGSPWPAMTPLLEVLATRVRRRSGAGNSSLFKSGPLPVTMDAKKPKVIVTRKLPDPVETRTRELFDTELNLTDDPLTRVQLEDAVGRA